MKTRFIKQIGRIIVLYNEKHDIITRFVFPGIFDKDLIDEKFSFELLKSIYPNIGFMKYSPLYDNETGEPMPGDLYYDDWLPENFFWENHKGPHLCCILPNGDQWNIDSRANNCDMKEDKLHRCWVRHGLPENGELVHVDKNGLTCGAGAGSILCRDYHGFLHNGELTQVP